MTTPNKNRMLYLDIAYVHLFIGINGSPLVKGIVRIVSSVLSRPARNGGTGDNLGTNIEESNIVVVKIAGCARLVKATVASSYEISKNLV